MAPTTVIIRSTTLLFSFILIALSITVFYTSLYASYRLKAIYPGGYWYDMWYGPVKTYTGTDGYLHWEFDLKLVGLQYDYSPERFSFVAAGLSIFVGAFSVILETARLFNLRGNKKNRKPATTSKALSITTTVLPTIAFIVSLTATIFVNVQNRKVGSATCKWEELLRKDTAPTPIQDSYTCTRELAACHVVDNFLGSVERTGCVELQISRQTLIPLAMFSGLVALAYGAQMWLARKEKNGGFAGEKLRRLEEDEDEE